MCSCPTAGSCAVLRLHIPRAPPAYALFCLTPVVSFVHRCLLFPPPFADCKATVSTTPPRTSSAKRGSTTPPTSSSKAGSISKVGCGLKLGIRRGKQRWSALVSAPTSRLAAYMRDRLGDALWSDFVRHANRHYKARLLPQQRNETMK